MKNLGVITLWVVVAMVGACSPEAPDVSREKPVTTCRVIAEDELGPGETLNLAVSNGRFLLAAQQGKVAVSQVYVAATGEHLEGTAYLDSMPLPRTSGVGKIGLLFGTNYGYLLLSTDNEGQGEKDWLTMLDSRARKIATYLPAPGTDPFVAPSAGVSAGGDEYLVDKVCDTAKSLTYYTTYLMDKDYSVHPGLFSSFQVSNDLCGNARGMARLGKTTPAVLVQRFGTDGKAYLTVVTHPLGATWSRFEVTDALARTGQNDKGFVVSNFFAEEDRFSVAWLNAQDGTNHLRSFDTHGMILNDLALSPDVSDVVKVPGGYVLAAYNSTSQRVRADLIDSSGRQLLSLPIFDSTLATRLPLMTWDAASKNILYAWIDEGRRPMHTVFSRTLHCE